MGGVQTCTLSLWVHCCSLPQSPPVLMVDAPPHQVTLTSSLFAADFHFLQYFSFHLQRYMVDLYNLDTQEHLGHSGSLQPALILPQRFQFKTLHFPFCSQVMSYQLKCNFYKTIYATSYCIYTYFNIRCSVFNVAFYLLFPLLLLIGREKSSRDYSDR